MGNDAKKKYLRLVSARLPCAKADKAKCLDFIGKAIDDIEQQNDAVELELLVSHLGTPKDVAKELKATIEPAQLSRHNLKKRIAVVAIILVIASLLVGFYWYLVYQTKEPIYYLTTIYEVVYSENETTVGVSVNE